MKNIVTGNMGNEATKHRGWIMGHFMPDNSPFKTGNVEIKWANHKAGVSKKSVAKNMTAYSLCILVRGKETFYFGDRKVELKKEGDYVFYKSGVEHSWVAEEDCLSITVRWPSIPNDQQQV